MKKKNLQLGGRKRVQEGMMGDGEVLGVGDSKGLSGPAGQRISHGDFGN